MSTTIDWTDILKTYGVAAAVLAFIAVFVWKKGWPSYIEGRLQSRQDRKDEMGGLLNAMREIQATNREQAKAMTEQTIAMERLATNANKQGRAFTELANEVRRKKPGRK